MRIAKRVDLILLCIEVACYSEALKCCDNSRFGLVSLYNFLCQEKRTERFLYSIARNNSNCIKVL